MKQIIHRLLTGLSCLVVGLSQTSLAESLVERINAPIKYMKQPAWYSGVIRVPLQVTSSSQEASNRVRHGFGMLHSGWDFEAYRNFAAALNLDPDCLTAYTGLLYLSASSDSPSAPHQSHLLDTVGTLAAKKTTGDTFHFSDQERAYATAITLMVVEGRQASADHLEEVTKRFPYDLQATMLEKVFTPRLTGPLGEKLGADPAEEIASLIQKHKYNPITWAYWLAFNQDEKNSDNLKAKIIPVASTLAKWDPRIPTWQVTLGQFQMKAGLNEEASKSFANALEIYEDWASANRVPPEYNDGFWRAAIYETINLYQSGKFDAALAAALELQLLDIDSTARTKAAGLYRWEVQTLPARLYIARNQKGDLDNALKTLPSESKLKSQQENSAAPIYIEGMMAYIGARKAIAAGDPQAAAALLERLGQVLDKMEKSKEDLSAFSDKGNFIRCYDALKLYNAEAFALAARLKKDKTSYRLWAESASEHQANARKHVYLPPHVIQDMADLPK